MATAGQVALHRLINRFYFSLKEGSFAGQDPGQVLSGGNRYDFIPPPYQPKAAVKFNLVNGQRGVHWGIFALILYEMILTSSGGYFPASTSAAAKVGYTQVVNDVLSLFVA